jgi:mycothiol synthase
MPVESDPDRIERHDAPRLPGLTFRPYGGEADARAMAAVREGCRARDEVDPLSALEGTPTAAELVAAYAGADRKNVLIVEMAGQVAGYSRISGWQEQDGAWLYLCLGWLLPEWRGHGIGTAMLRWAEDRCRAVAGEHPAEGRRLFGANASSTERDTTALLRNAGYSPVFSLVEMALEDLHRLPELPMPAGFTLRPALPEQYRAIWASIQEAYSASTEHQVATEAEYQAYFGKPNLDPTLWQVAWDGEQVAGQVLCEILKGRGEVAEVSVRGPWRGRGLARALLVLGLHALRERGVRAVRMHTRADNRYGSVRLYESIGFRALKHYVRYRKPMEVDRP